MKKGFGLVILLVLAIMLTACGGKENIPAAPTGASDEKTTVEVTPETTTEEVKASKEELMENAEVMITPDFISSFVEGTSGDYLNTPLIVNMWVFYVDEEHAVLSGTRDPQLCVDVYMPAEDLAAVKVGDYIGIVGIADEIQELSLDKPDGSGGIISPHLIMPNAYLIEVKPEEDSQD